MDAAISAGQARTGARVRWKPILYGLAATPFVAILAMELYYKLPLAIDSINWPRIVSVSDRESETSLDGYAQHSIAAKCEERWPSDRAMQHVCARNAEAGLADLARIYIANVSMPNTGAALRDCFVSNTAKGVTDFALVGICARTHELNSRLETPIPALLYPRQAGHTQSTTKRHIPSADRRPALRSGARPRA